MMTSNKIKGNKEDKREVQKGEAQLWSHAMQKVEKNKIKKAKLSSMLEIKKSKPKKVYEKSAANHNRTEIETQDSLNEFKNVGYSGNFDYKR